MEASKSFLRSLVAFIEEEEAPGTRRSPAKKKKKKKPPAEPNTYSDLDVSASSSMPKPDVDSRRHSRSPESFRDSLPQEELEPSLPPSWTFESKPPAPVIASRDSTPPEHENGQPQLPGSNLAARTETPLQGGSPSEDLT